MSFKGIIKKIVPSSFLYLYHYFLARLSSFVYGNPSSKMVIFGVTGTGGKSTVTYLSGKIFELCSQKVGWTSTISFKIGEQEIPNSLKMTMPGRFFLNRVLRKMLRFGSRYVFIETTSQGIEQARHKGINYDVALLTNLSPEHIESHGSFENYKREKGKLFAEISKNSHKIIDGKKIPKVIVVNLDDKEASYFLNFSADKYYGYTLGKIKVSNDLLRLKKVKIIQAYDIDCGPDYLKFKIFGKQIYSKLLGEFNVYNILACFCLADIAGIDFSAFKKALAKIHFIPGRLEEVISSPFSVFVDYAHTPHELEKVYQALEKRGGELICVLGSAGGGRDKWKRPELGRIAGNYCQKIILTNEDPYDENPLAIINEIEKGVIPAISGTSKLCFKILDRKEAIKKAMSLAGKDSQIIITGKGSELCICGPHGKKIPWNDKQVCRELIKGFM